MPASTPATPSLLREIRQHATEAVRAVDWCDDPFPHFTVHGLFPDGFYRDLIDSLPADEVCRPIGTKTSVDGDAGCRLRFGLHDSSLAELSPAARELWAAARDTLRSAELRDAVYTKLTGGLALRYGCRPEQVAEKAPGFALPELYRETRGYRITPHPDTRKKVVTMQVSLARDDSQAGLGTEFYRRSFAPADWAAEPRGFVTVKTAPFTPNTASAFVVLNTMRLKSWHGRSTLAEQQGVRNSILNIWYAKAEDARRDQDRQAPALAAA